MPLCDSMRGETPRNVSCARPPHIGAVFLGDFRYANDVRRQSSLVGAATSFRFVNARPMTQSADKGVLVTSWSCLLNQASKSRLAVLTDRRLIYRAEAADLVRPIARRRRDFDRPSRVSSLMARGSRRL